MPTTTDVNFTFPLFEQSAQIAEIEGTAEITIEADQWWVSEVRLDILGTYDPQTRRSKQINATGKRRAQIINWITTDRYTNTSIEDAIRELSRGEAA